jgi:hypothetical protein
MLLLVRVVPVMVTGAVGQFGKFPFVVKDRFRRGWTS